MWQRPDLSIFRLIAEVASTDERWQGVEFRGDVIVRATSYEDARAVAIDSAKTTHCLDDADLYSVVEVNYGEDFR